MWSGKDNQPIYSLLFISSTQQMLAFISDGIMCFDANIEDNEQIFDQMEGNLVFQVQEGKNIELGVEVANNGSPQIWVCSRIDTMFYVLDTRNFNVLSTFRYTREEILSKIQVTPDKESSIMCADTITNFAEAVEVQNIPMIAVANKWLLVVINCSTLEVQEVFDCWEYCNAQSSSKISGEIHVFRLL